MECVNDEKTEKNTNLCNCVAFEEVRTLLGILSIFRSPIKVANEMSMHHGN